MRSGFHIDLARGARHRKVMRDLQQRRRSYFFELKRLYLKYMEREGLLSIIGPWRRVLRKVCYTKVRNRCIYTGKARGVLSKYKMSRVSFRELCINGELGGFRKASW
jgi:ribosomal protein S14